jgi:hypothetical protein
LAQIEIPPAIERTVIACACAACLECQRTAVGRGCVKTLEALMMQCIFGHVGSISRDFIDSNRALSNLHRKWFGF